MWKQIFKTALIAGFLDITGACIQVWLTKNITPEIILKYIASGIFGKVAFAGGAGFILFGLFIHFFIAFACTMIYFLLYPKLKWFHKNFLLSSFFVAVITWAVTSRVIVPLSKIVPAPFNITNAVIAIAILYCCIGLPVCFFAKRYYTNKKIKSSNSLIQVRHKDRIIFYLATHAHLQYYHIAICCSRRKDRLDLYCSAGGDRRQIESRRKKIVPGKG